jgi:predicted small lipoprotein YifL
MKNFKILTIVLIIFVLAGCDIKISLSPENNQSANNEQEQSGDQDTDASADTDRIAYEVLADEAGVVSKILNKDTGEILTEDLVDLCGNEMIYFAHPQDLPFIIFKPYLTEEVKLSDGFYSLNLQLNKCQELEISQELDGSSFEILSPDQTKIALALEKDDARILKLLDLVNDKALTLVELADEETLNGGYSGETNHFDIKWMDNKMIQYTVYEKIIDDYDANTPDNIAKVLQVRVVSID